MKQYVENFNLISSQATTGGRPGGDSASPKGLVFHILRDNSLPIQVLDIGFGCGGLGSLIRENSATQHWQVDGIDGFEPNCQNLELINKKIYRNIWYGFAQELPSEQICKYNIICLLDVIEHLDIGSSKYLLRHLLSCMAEDAHLFMSTPLWFYPQSTQQHGDLEEHLIGIPASSIMALLPKLYAVSHPLIGGFVFNKKSLEFINFFQPTTDKSFSYEKGMKICQAVGMNVQPGIAFPTGF